METPNYYAIVPANIRYAKNLSMFQKLLYAEITALTQKDGFCWASNNYFAQLYGFSVGYISRQISDLAKKGYLVISIDKERGNLRKIYIGETRRASGKIPSTLTQEVQTLPQKSKAIVQNDKTIAQKSKTYDTKGTDPYCTKVQYNNINNNNKNNNNTISVCDKYLGDNITTRENTHTENFPEKKFSVYPQTAETPETEKTPKPQKPETPETQKEKSSAKKEKVNEAPIYKKFAHLAITDEEKTRLEDAGYCSEDIDEILEEIENYAGNKKYKSLYLTAKKWLKMRLESGKIHKKTPNEGGAGIRGFSFF